MDVSITLTEELLLLYGTDYFVETGTFKGGAVKMAIEAGFSDIRSIDVDEAMYLAAVERFNNDSRVTLYHGDSLKLLSEMIADITEPITFWLDAHDGNAGSGSVQAPLLEELRIIGEHCVKDHVILIDDVQLMGKSFWHDVTKEKVEEAIKKINPLYQIYYEDSRAYKRDILVAVVKREE